MGEGADVGAVHLCGRAWDARGDEREGAVGVDGEAGGRVDDVFAEAVAGLHEGVEVAAGGVDGDPAGVVAGVRGVDGADELEFGAVGGGLLVDPELVGREVGGVEEGFCGVEHHAVDARVGVVGVVLDVCLEGARGGDGEDVAVGGVLVERVAVDCVGGLLRREEEDCAGVCC